MRSSKFSKVLPSGGAFNAITSRGGATGEEAEEENDIDDSNLAGDILV